MLSRRGEAGWGCWLTVRDVVGYQGDGGGPGPDEEERDDHLGEDAPVHPEEVGPFRVLPNVPGPNLPALVSSTLLYHPKYDIPSAPKMLPRSSNYRTGQTHEVIVDIQRPGPRPPRVRRHMSGGRLHLLERPRAVPRRRLAQVQRRQLLGLQAAVGADSRGPPARGVDSAVLGHCCPLLSILCGGLGLPGDGVLELVGGGRTGIKGYPTGAG